VIARFLHQKNVLGDDIPGESSPGETARCAMLEDVVSRVVKFDENQNSSQFSGIWHGNISDSGQPAGALILSLKRKSTVVT
jgi:hypothetical protein